MGNGNVLMMERKERICICLGKHFPMLFEHGFHHDFSMEIKKRKQWKKKGK